MCNRNDTKRYHLLVYLENKYPAAACHPYFIIYLTLIFISVFTFMVCYVLCHAFDADKFKHLSVLTLIDNGSLPRY